MRALYQRKRGRDPFDLAVGLEKPATTPDRIIETFSEYLNREGRRVTRAQFEENMARRMRDPLFTADIGPLPAADFLWDIDEAAAAVLSQLIPLLPGDAWGGDRNR